MDESLSTQIDAALVLLREQNLPLAATFLEKSWATEVSRSDWDKIKEALLTGPLAISGERSLDWEQVKSEPRIPGRCAPKPTADSEKIKERLEDE